jgi:TetR/AcrR family transcriptional repressor of lmrAB and yxaGH operons
MNETPKTPPKPPLKTRPTRERILRAGLHLFQAQGYHATGIAEILARSRAPKGSFYHHFPGGKEQLAIVALEWLQAEVAGFLDRIAAEGGGSREMMLGLTRHAAQGLDNLEVMRGSLLAVLAQEAIPGAPAVHAALRLYAGSVHERLVASRAREGAPEAAARAFADQGLALLQGGSLLARIDGGPGRLEHLIAAWLC